MALLVYLTGLDLSVGVVEVNMIVVVVRMNPMEMVV